MSPSWIDSIDSNYRTSIGYFWIFRSVFAIVVSIQPNEVNWHKFIRWPQRWQNAINRLSYFDQPEADAFSAVTFQIENRFSWAKRMAKLALNDRNNQRSFNGSPIITNNSHYNRYMNWLNLVHEFRCIASHRILWWFFISFHSK